jgi:type I restriction enzyme R subunit
LAKPNVFLTPFEVTFTFWSKLVWLLWASSEIQIMFVLSLSSSVSFVFITDRTDLDDQLSGQLTNAKSFIGDDNIKSVESRAELRTLMQGRRSGGVFLTTIHKFTEDTELLSERTNIICISDEAHRSQTNLDQKVKVTSKGVKKTFGFAKYLHDSLPNATFVGFTGTPIDATLEAVLYLP